MKFSLLFCLATFVAACTSDAATANRVSAKLISDKEQIANGTMFRIGVHFTIPEHAHIYWSNPGDSGLPTSVTWTLPPGVQADDLQWPNPKTFVDHVLKETSFAYEHEVLLFAYVHPSRQLKTGDALSIHVKAAWLVCLEDAVCIPEEATLSLALRVGAEPVVSSNTAAFDEYTSRVPRRAVEAGVPVEITTEGNPMKVVRVFVRTPWRVEPEAAVGFFPYSGGAWKQIGAPKAEGESNAVVFERSPRFDTPVSVAITLPIINDQAGEKRFVYLRVNDSSQSR